MEIGRAALKRHHEYLAKYVTDIILMMDEDLRIVEVNDRAVEIYGYSRDELLRMTLFDIRVTETLPDIAELKAQWNDSDGVIYEVLHHRKDGTAFLVEVSTRLMNFEGETFYQSICRDISERELVVEKLRRSERNLQTLIGENVDSIIIVEGEGFMRFVNPAAEALFGRKAANMLGTSLGFPVVSGESTEIDIFGRGGVQAIAEMRATTVDWEGKEAFLVSLRDITERKQAEKEKQQSFEKERKALEATVRAISEIVERRDPYTSGHQRRVGELARAIAAEMKLSADQIEGIGTASLIHDIGKISIPAEILTRPSNLSDIEFGLIKEHSRSGYEILKDIEFPWPIARMVLEHHEKMDGSGYPNGLSREQLLIESRIITVADVVEAMASHRPYRPGLGLEAALAEIVKQRGIHYDPEVVDACMRLFREKGFKSQFDLQPTWG